MPHLFDPFAIGSVTFPNRVVVAPMCQYSADDGSATDWHLQHLMQMALGRAGLVMVEATGVERDGRISHGCLGLYSDANEAALAKVLAAARSVAAPGTRFGIQIAHAGRKGSAERPWEGGGALKPDANPWVSSAPSAIAFAPNWHTPQALDAAGLARVKAAFVQAAQRAARLGFDVIELHIAHGYLLHEFTSALSNTRTDSYGGSLENRLRFPLEIAAAVRAVVPNTAVLGSRITGSDWMDGGISPDDAVVLAKGLKSAGVEYACVSSGGLSPAAKIALGPNYQVPFAAKVKSEAGITTRAVGLIVEPAQAEAIVTSGQADCVALARGILDDPRWVWHAAERLGATVALPPQYDRVRRANWPGAAMARPGIA